MIDAPRCGACGLRLAPPAREPEACWWCNGDLCYACWDEIGHCGHAEAEAVNERMRHAGPAERAAMARAVVGDGPDVLHFTPDARKGPPS